MCFIPINLKFLSPAFVHCIVPFELLEIEWTMCYRYNDVTMSAMGSQITSVSIEYCLLNRLFRRKSKKTSKLCVTGLCGGNSPVTGEFPAQWASDAENVSMWCRHHVYAPNTKLWITPGDRLIIINQRRLGYGYVITSILWYEIGLLIHVLTSTAVKLHPVRAWVIISSHFLHECNLLIQMLF